MRREPNRRDRWDKPTSTLRFNWVSLEDRWTVYRRDNFTCCDCGQLVSLIRSWWPDAATLDHIVARSNGGSDDLTNLRLLCRRCNSRKGARY